MARSDDLEVAARYGAEHPDDFGGLYLDQGIPVVLFTRSLNRHAAALRGIVTRLDQLRVESADHGWLEMMAMKDQVSRMLMGEDRRFGFNGVGIGVHEGQFVVSVFVVPYTSKRARAVEHAVRGYPVRVEPGHHITLA